MSGTALVLATLLAALPAHTAQSQIGGLIKKKAIEAAKGKDKASEEASTAPADSCGPITPQKVEDFLRGVQAEASTRIDYDATAAKASADKERADSVAKACRNAETGGQTMLQMMTEGFTGANAPSTPAAVQAQTEKNKARWEQYLDKKCGKDPGVSRGTTYDSRQAYAQAHAAGAKAAGMSEHCYDVMTDKVIAFCRLPKNQQAAAAEKGLRVDKLWLFTADEAKVLQSRCSDLLAGIKKTGNTLVP